jgi:secreted trypsin-like serine protease
MISKPATAAWLLAAAGVVCVLPAQAAMMHDSVDTGLYETHAETLPSVGWVAARNGSNPWHYVSGVLIEPRWVLTAGHAAVGSDGSVFDEFQFGVGSNYLTAPGETAAVLAAYAHPDYDPAAPEGSTPDLALLYLSDPIQTVAPAARFVGVDAVGTEVHFAGYGRPGTPSTGVQPADGQTRGFVGTIDGFGDPGEGLTTDYATVPFTDVGPFFDALGGLATSGDSGGGMFVDSGGEYQLAGIMALNLGGFDYGGSTASMRVSLYNDWIDATIAEVPEPSALVLLLAAAAMLVWQAGRQRR